MSRRGASNSKFGHLFGDDSSKSGSGSGSGSRPSVTSGDLYRDPLASMIKPLVPTTTTTNATTSRPTSPGTNSSSATANLLSFSPPTSPPKKASPPTSGSSSRASSRLQHHALFSSLTAQDSGSIFESPLLGATSDTSSVSSSKRDFLFGDSGSEKRTSTPPLSKAAQTAKRVPSPPITSSTTTVSASGPVRVTSPLDPLDAEDSPLGSAIPRPSSATSSKSSVSIDSLTTNANNTNSSSSQSNINANVGTNTNTNTRISTSSTTTTPTSIKPPPGPPKVSHSQKSSVSSIISNNAPAKRLSTNPQPTPLGQSPEVAAVESIPNPLLGKGAGSSHSPTPSTSSSIGGGVSSSGGSNFRQSISTFQSLSRSSSPLSISNNSTNINASDASSPATPTIANSGFAGMASSAGEGFESDSSSPTLSGRPSYHSYESSVQEQEQRDRDREREQTQQQQAQSRQQPRRQPSAVLIPPELDESAGAFAQDQFLNITHTRLQTATPLSGFEHSPELDSFASSLRLGSSSSILGGSSLVKSTSTSSSLSTSSATSPEVSAASRMPSLHSRARTTSELPSSLSGEGPLHSRLGNKSLTGFSLGEDVADSSNPWETPLAAVNDELATQKPKKLNVAGSMMETDPGFENVFGEQGSRSGGATKSNSGGAGAGGGVAALVMSPPLSSSQPSSILISKVSVVETVKSLASDPEFYNVMMMGAPQDLLPKGEAKIREIMQMPKDPLEKDVSAQEVFDNPWE